MMLVGIAAIDQAVAAINPQVTQAGSCLSGLERKKSGIKYHANETPIGTIIVIRTRSFISVSLDMRHDATITTKHIGINPPSSESNIFIFVSLFHPQRQP